MAAGGQPPNVKGGPGVDLAKLKSSLDDNATAQKALADTGISSADYVVFLGAAMQSMIVGQMEAAGMKNMLPPGITKRPSQANIDFMKSNMDLLQRAITPGAPAAANATARVAANTSDEALPMPKDAGAVLPSAILAKVPALSTITATTDCSLGDLPAIAQRESAKANQQLAAYYGNPGMSGLGRTPAESAVLEHAENSDLELCGVAMNFVNQNTAEWRAAEERKGNELSAVTTEEGAAWAACPGIPGGKEPACERAVSAAAARKTDEIEKRYLLAVSPLFADMVSQMQACEVKREAIVKEAHAANVAGANVKLVLRPLVLAWELPPGVVAQWSGICEDAQRRLLKK
jgi:hypothetical protein